MATVTELVTKFSFQGDESPLNSYNLSLGKSIGLLAGMAAASVAAVGAIGSWASGVLAAEQPLINLSSEAGVAVERLQELAFVAEQSNSSTEALQSSITGLSQKIGEAAQKGSEDFARLGISVRGSNGEVKSADIVLGEIGQRFRDLNLSMAEQQGFAAALGIDRSLITLLGRTSDEMSGLISRARELGTLNAEQISQAAEYNDSLTAVRFGLDGMRRLIAVGLAPEMTNLSNSFTDLLIDNKDWIVNGVKFSVGVLTDFIGLLGRTWEILAVGAGVFFALKVATLGWGGALALVFSPIVIATGLILGALVVIDDLIVALNGGKSLIRDFFLSFFGFDIQPVLRGIVDGFKNIFSTGMDILTGFLTAIGGLFSGIGNILSGNFIEGLGDIGQAINIFYETLREAFFNLFGGLFDWIGAKLSGLLPSWAADLLGLDGDTQSTTIGSDASFAPGATSNSTVSSSNVNQDVSINVSTSDPERAGRAVADNLQAQMRDAQAQSNRGGM